MHENITLTRNNNEASPSGAPWKPIDDKKFRSDVSVRLASVLTNSGGRVKKNQLGQGRESQTYTPSQNEIQLLLSFFFCFTKLNCLIFDSSMATFVKVHAGSYSGLKQKHLLTFQISNCSCSFTKVSDPTNSLSGAESKVSVRNFYSFFSFQSCCQVRGKLNYFMS